MTSAIGGIVGGIGSIIGGSTAASGQQQAAATEAAAQQAATQAELSMFNTTQQNLAPYNLIGQQAESQLYGEMKTPDTSGVPGIALGGMPSLTDLSQLPGYQFTLDQGEKATANAAAAQGLGVSGVALKGAGTYAEQFANTFGSQYLQNYWTNQNNRYNQLYNLTLTGQAAAANVGQAATATGQNIASSTLSGAAGVAAAQSAAATAQGAGYTGAANQIGNALTTSLLGSSGTTVTPATSSAGYAYGSSTGGF